MFSPSSATLPTRPRSAGGSREPLANTRVSFRRRSTRHPMCWQPFERLPVDPVECSWWRAITMTERRSTLPTTHPACQACVRWISESWPDLMKPVYSSSLDRFVSPVTLCSCRDTSEPTPRSPESTDWIEAGSMTLTSSTGTPIHLYSSQQQWVQETLPGLGGL